MMSYVLGAVLITGTAGYAAFRVRRWLDRQAFLLASARFLSGHRKDSRPGRARRAAWRSGSVLAAVALVAGWLASPQVTGWALILCFTVSVMVVTWRAWRLLAGWRHHRVWLRPLHLAAHEVAQIDRRRRPGEWLAVEPDRSRAVLALPSGWPADATDKQRLVAIAAAKLGMESPEASWGLAGPDPQLELSMSQPPPARVALADVREHLDRLKADELLWGLGKRGALVTSSLSGDSPHVGLSMGSGSGKSLTAGFLLAQMLYHGAVGLILDYKMISHQWAAGLPNVAIARRPHEIHAALLWLGGEAERRNEVALAGSDMDGNVHAVVGGRLIVVCEELNATMSKLRAYWRGLRNEDRSLPQRSPALEALDSVNLMGRQVLMNLIYMGQRLSVKAIGGDGDARESIGVVALGRYKPPAWKMLAGDFPMPPASLAPGRIQVVSDRVREAQGVLTSARERRELAVAGTVTPCPGGMPGAGGVADGTAAQIPGPDLGVVSGTVLVAPSLAARVTLSEAVAEGIVSCSLHAVRQAAQRDRDCPVRAGLRGLAGEWDAVALAEWDAGRR